MGDFIDSHSFSRKLFYEFILPIRQDEFVESLCSPLSSQCL